MKSDEELRKTFEIFVDEEDIIHLTALKIESDHRENTRSTELVEEDISKILNAIPQKKYKFLVDISAIGSKSYAFNRNSRKIGVRIAANKQLKKIAYITKSMFLRAVIGFIIKAAGRSEIVKCFSSGEEASGWLKKE